MNDTSPLQYAAQHRDRFIKELKELLAIPSISTLPEHDADMRRAAGWLRDRLTGIGFDAEVIPGDGHPLVYAEWLQAEGAPTVLVYGHYDVQPVDPIDLWESPPFEPTVRGGNIYARGASDDKGQTLTAINAAESLLLATGSLPLNIKFLIEGEEEHGGHVVTQYIKDHGDRLTADVAQVSDTAMFAPGIPTLDTGLRGMVAAQVYARGASHDLHSGVYGGAAPNPLVALAQIIAGLKDVSGTITIPGFYDDVVMPEEAVLQTWRELPFDEAAYLAEEVGATALTGEAGYSVLERTWARPTLDVHGIPGGFTDTGFKTVIPAHAEAKISMRLVPNQRAGTILELFSQRVRELTPPGIEIEITAHASDPVLVPTDSPYVQAARSALEATFGRPAVLARSGGSIPIVTLFKEVLAVDSVLMGWGLPDDNLHAPNEKLSLDNFVQGIDTVIRFWQSAAKVARP